MGVPVPSRDDRPRTVTEPEPPSWSDIELHLAHYEDALRDQPALRDHVLSLARQLRRYAEQLSGPMPAAVAAAFTRIGV